VKRRVAEQLKTAAIKNYEIELDEAAERDDARSSVTLTFEPCSSRRVLRTQNWSDAAVRVADLRTVVAEIRRSQSFSGTHHQTFSMRQNKPRREEDACLLPFDLEEDITRYRASFGTRRCAFGKTFTAYQLAKKLGAKRFWWSPSNPPLRMPGSRTLNPMLILKVAVSLPRFRHRSSKVSAKKAPRIFRFFFKTCLAATSREH